MAGLVKYGDQPEKYKDHILIFDGRKSGDMVESDLANKLYHILEKKGLNPVVYTDNDTVKYETMKKIIFTVDEKEEGVKKAKNDAVKHKIPFYTLRNESEVENFCNSI